MKKVFHYFGTVIVAFAYVFSVVQIVLATPQTSLKISIKAAIAVPQILDTKQRILESIVMPVEIMKKRVSRVVPRLVKSDDGQNIEWITETVVGKFLVSHLPKIRISNITKANMISVEIAPAAGRNAAWQGPDNFQVAFNNPASTQLSVDLTQSKLLLLHGKTAKNAGLPKQATFTAGVVDSITLINSAEKLNEFDLTGVALLQALPADAPNSTKYRMHFILTTV